MAEGLTVKIRADASNFQRGITSVRGSIGALSAPIGALTTATTALAAGMAAAGAAAVGITYKLIKWGEGALAADRRTMQIVKSMDVFGSRSTNVAKRLEEVADATALATGTGGDMVQQVQSVVATFKPLLETAGKAGGLFDRVVEASINMSAALGIDAKSAATQLSKALSDPVNQMSALSRTGAILRKEVDQLKEAFAEHGDEARLVSELLSNVERQVGGAARATATGTSQIGEAISQVRDELAKPIAVAFEEIADQIAGDTPRIKAAVEGMAPQIYAGAKTAFGFIREAFLGSPDELVQVGMAVGKLLTSGVITGIKAGASGIVLSLIEAINPALNKIGAGLSEADLQTMREGRSFAIRQDLTTAMQQASLDLPSMSMAQPAAGQTFRLANEGEQSVFRDNLGRMVVLLETANQRLTNIDQKTSSPPNFPQSP